MTTRTVSLTSTEVLGLQSLCCQLVSRRSRRISLIRQLPVIPTRHRDIQVEVRQACGLGRRSHEPSWELLPQPMPRATFHASSRLEGGSPAGARTGTSGAGCRQALPGMRDRDTLLTRGAGCGRGAPVGDCALRYEQQKEDEANAARKPLAQGTEPPMGTGDGDDPRSPANRGWGWGWTPHPRQIGDGDGDGPPIPGKSGIGPGDGDDPRL